MNIPSRESKVLEKKLFEERIYDIGFDRLIEKDRKSKSAVPPQYIRHKLKVEEKEVSEGKVWTFAAIGKKKSKYLFYLHGGGFVLTFFPAHWKLISDLVEETGYTAVVPAYPLAPETPYPGALNMIYEVFCELAGKVGAENIVVAGDSAGASLALALCMKLRDEGQAQARKAILICPCLDISLSNPEIGEVRKTDPLLDVDLQIECGRAYTGAADKKNPYISPLYGDMKNLAPIYLFTGTHDILWPDCKKLYERARKEKIDFHYFEYEGMIHDWILFPIPESKEVLVTLSGELK